MQAAIGRAQLRKLDTILERKRANAGWMSRRLEHVPGITPPYQLPHATSPHMLYTCLVDGDRDAVLDHLARSRNRGARLFPARAPAADLRAASIGALPVTEAVAARMLSIPMHSRLTPGELTRIADAMEEAVSRSGRPAAMRRAPLRHWRRVGPDEPAQGRRGRAGHDGTQPRPGAERSARRRTGRRDRSEPAGAKRRARRSRSPATWKNCWRSASTCAWSPAPTLMHFDVGLRLAEAGVHTLIEKPVTSEPRSGRLLAQAFRRARPGRVRGAHREIQPGAARLARPAGQGELGSVFQIATRRQGPFPAPDSRCRRGHGPRHP